MVWPMRSLILALGLAAAGPSASAQPSNPVLDDLRFQQESAQRRAIDQQNQLNALESRLRAEQAVIDLRAEPPRLPELRYKPATGGVTPAMPPNYPAVPDAMLADSNRRVQDAVRNRR